MDLTQAVDLISRLGVWGLIIVFAVWIRPWLEKIFRSHLDLVATLKEEQPKQTANLKAIQESTEATREGTKDVIAAVERLVDGQSEIVQAVDKLGVRIEHLTLETANVVVRPKNDSGSG